ncbi:ABC transporter substrate-binding protein [Rhodobacterales bacterium HKCCE3408]|nr:ABC transporter substrate-binding protein [Rhodobacterales bacterium HKCCE3408]
MKFNSVTLASAAAFGLLAVPAAAQDAEICAGLGPAQWIAGDEAGSDVSTAGGPLDMTGLSVPPGGNVVRAFSVSAQGDVRVEAMPTPGGDTVLELYSADGALVLTDDDSGGNFASRAEAALDPGTYCLLTRSFGGGAVDASIRVARPEFDALTPGLGGGSGFFAGVEACTAETPATALGQGPVDAMLGQGGVTATNSVAATPYYRFTLSSPQPISIRAENEWADPYIYVFDGQGALIAENDDYDSLNSRIDFTDPLPAGDYCVGMRALSDQNEPVTISVRGYDPQAAMMEMYASGEASPPPGSGYPVTALGMLQTRLVMDQPVGSDAVWYSFDVPEGGLVLIDAIGITDADPVIRLFDSVGRMVGFNDDSNGTLDSQLSSRVGPGTYMLGVTQYSSGYRGVIRVTIERYVPAR